MKLLIVNDNTLTQTNGVVTTFDNVIKQLANYTTVELKYVTVEEFYNIPSFLYPDVRLVLNPWKITKIIKQFNPTHIHIATEGCLGVVTKLTCDHKKISYTTSFHTRWDMFFKRIAGFDLPLINKYLLWFHSKSQKIFATTKGMKEQLEIDGYQNVIEWSRGVDNKLFTFMDHIISDKPRLLSVGRVSAEKNLTKFCELSPEKYELICVGDGPILKKLQQDYPHVIFLGELKGPELAKQYQLADCFVFTSVSDTFGLVMIEAMSTGTPTAGYPVQGPLDVIDVGYSGYLCEDIENAIDLALTLPRKTVHEISKKWSWENTTDIFLDNLVARDEKNENN